MCKKISPFFILCFFGPVNAMQHEFDNLRIVSVDRSPSACLTMDEFTDEIIRKFRETIALVREARQDYSAPITVDFNGQLLRLFERLETSQDEKEAWKTKLQELSKTLTVHHHAIGIKISYRTPKDLAIIASLIQPLIDAKKLGPISLNSCCQSTTP